MMLSPSLRMLIRADRAYAGLRVACNAFRRGYVYSPMGEAAF